MNIDTGTQTCATQFWNREAFVGLRSSAEAIRLGSQFTLGLWLGARIDPFTRQGTGPHQTLLGWGGAAGPWSFAGQYNNSIQYLTPVYNGFVGKVLVGAKDGVLTNASWAMRVEYTPPRFIVGISYDGEATTSASANLPPGVSVVASAAQVGAVYDFGAFKLYGLYLRAMAKGSTDMNGKFVGAMVTMMPLEFLATAVVRDMEDARDSDASLIPAQMRHNFSKRTFVYLSAAKQTNDGNSRFGVYSRRVDGTAVKLRAKPRSICSGIPSRYPTLRLSGELRNWLKTARQRSRKHRTALSADFFLTHRSPEIITLIGFNREAFVLSP